MPSELGLTFNFRETEWLDVLEWPWGGVALAVPWGRSCNVLERILGWFSSGLGASWSGLGASWGDLGTSWDDLEASWDVLGRSWVVLEPSCSHLGAVLGPSWSHLGASMGRLGTVLGRLGVFFGSFLWLSSELRKSSKNAKFLLVFSGLGSSGKGSCGGLGASWTVLRRLESALRADEKL